MTYVELIEAYQKVLADNLPIASPEFLEAEDEIQYEDMIVYYVIAKYFEK